MAEQRTVKVVKQIFEAVHNPVPVGEKLAFYDDWAVTFNQVSAQMLFILGITLSLM